MIRKLLPVLLGMLLAPAVIGAMEVYRNGDMALDVGFWGQAWYQYVGDYDRDGDGRKNDDINDFMVRRAYFSVAGTVTPKLCFFLHFAGDRLGQEGVDNSGMGLGTGMAVRDLWVNYKLLGDDLMVQVGRMYVPFSRNYGTTSTKSLLTTELDWGQGGLRSGIFYPSKVGRDDSVTVWGNVFRDKLQYRLMVGEGVESGHGNPDDSLRFAGRLSLNLFEPETGWFNAGTYLGKKKVLAVGAGFDFQPDLVMGADTCDYAAYTADVHLDLPLECCAVTAELAWFAVNNSVNGVTWSGLTAGTDGNMLTTKAGVLLKGDLQPFGHCQFILPDGTGLDDTVVYGFGCNYYIKGAANKLTAEWSQVDDGSDRTDIITVQAAFGF